jgi:hypothetical protein
MLLPFDSAGLHIEAAGPNPGDLAGIRLIWTGRSAARTPGESLLPYFNDVLQMAAETTASVTMHFELLDHFNSATVATLVQLIEQARARGVPLLFVHDEKVKWQKLTFDALRVFVKDDDLFRVCST